MLTCCNVDVVSVTSSNYSSDSLSLSRSPVVSSCVRELFSITKSTKHLQMPPVCIMWLSVCKNCTSLSIDR